MINARADEIGGIPGVAAGNVGFALAEPPLSEWVFVLLQRELAQALSAGGNRPIDDFTARPARRERPLGRRYLTVLAQSTHGLREIVYVDYGSSVFARRLPEKSNPADKAHRVHHPVTSETLSAGDILLGGILTLPEGRFFTESVMPLSRSAAMKLNN